jgi:uncharacterized protein
MSQENVDLVRGAFEDYAQHGARPESPFMADDIVWNPADETPQKGRAAVVAYMERWESEWEDLRTVPEDFLDAGDRVVVTVHFSGRGRASGIDVDARMYEVYEVREGKIVRMDEFGERADALRLAGLLK